MFRNIGNGSVTLSQNLNKKKKGRQQSGLIDIVRWRLRWRCVVRPTEDLLSIGTIKQRVRIIDHKYKNTS